MFIRLMIHSYNRNGKKKRNKNSNYKHGREKNDN